MPTLSWIMRRIGGNKTILRCVLLSPIVEFSCSRCKGPTVRQHQSQRSPISHRLHTRPGLWQQTAIIRQTGKSAPFDKVFPFAGLQMLLSVSFFHQMSCPVYWFAWRRAGLPGERTMSRTINLHSPALCRRLSVLLTLLLCTVFVLPLPVADSVLTSNCSANAETAAGSGAQLATGKDGSVPFPCQNRPCGCRSASGCLKKCCCFTPAQKSAWAKTQPRRIDSSSHAKNVRTTSATDPSNARWHTVSFIQSVECQGNGLSAFCCIVSLTAPAATLPLPSTPDNRPHPDSEILPTASLQPPVPPPKLCA